MLDIVVFNLPWCCSLIQRPLQNAIALVLVKLWYYSEEELLEFNSRQPKALVKLRINQASICSVFMGNLHDGDWTCSKEPQSTQQQKNEIPKKKFNTLASRSYSKSWNFTFGSHLGLDRVVNWKRLKFEGFSLPPYFGWLPFKYGEAMDAVCDAVLACVLVARLW